MDKKCKEYKKKQAKMLKILQGNGFPNAKIVGCGCGQKRRTEDQELLIVK